MEWSNQAEVCVEAADNTRVDGAPSIAGLRFRAFRGVEDYPAMARVRESAGLFDRVDPLSARETIPTVDDLARDVADVQPGSPNMLFVEIGGALVGYNQMAWWTEQDGTWVYLHRGWLVPEWRGHGLGTAMLRWAEQRLRAVAAEHPTNGRAVLATNASSTEREATALALAEGYTLVHYLSDMALHDLTTLPKATLPPGLEARPALPEHYPVIYRAWKETWSGIALTTAQSEEDYQEFVDDNVHVPGFDPALWRVAWQGDEVAGFVFCRVRQGVGVVPEVAVRPAWRRRGLARALLVQGLRGLRERGVTKVRIITNAGDEQGARSLYESVGFRELKKHGLYRKPL